MATREMPGPQRRVTEVQTEGRRTYLLLDCGHRKLHVMRRDSACKWAYCTDCADGVP